MFQLIGIGKNGLKPPNSKYQLKLLENTKLSFYAYPTEYTISENCCQMLQSLFAVFHNSRNIQTVILQENIILCDIKPSRQKLGII